MDLDEATTIICKVMELDEHLSKLWIARALNVAVWDSFVDLPARDSPDDPSGQVRLLVWGDGDWQPVAPRVVGEVGDALMGKLEEIVRREGHDSIMALALRR